MNVRELMTREVLTVPPDASLKDVGAILAEHGISGLPVCDAGGRVLGVVSEGDILFKAQGARQRRGGALAWLVDSRLQSPAKQDARTAGEAITSPPITIGPERPAAAAARLMIEEGVNRLPVVSSDGKLVGIVTRADLVRAFTRADEEIVAEIRDDVLRRALWLEPDSVEITVQRGEVELAGEIETKSDVEVLRKLVQRIPGVVSVRSSVLYRVDDLQRAGVR